MTQHTRNAAFIDAYNLYQGYINFPNFVYMETQKTDVQNMYNYITL